MIALEKAYRRPLLAVLLVGAAIALLGATFSQFQESDLAKTSASTATPAPLPAAGGAPAAELHYNDGIAALKRGDAAAAALAFEKAAGLRPDVPAIHANLGFAYLEMDHPETARDSFWHALTLDPGHINAYYGLGEAYEALDDLIAASDAMRRYVNRSPESDPFRERARDKLANWVTKLAQGDARQNGGNAEEPEGPNARDASGTLGGEPKSEIALGGQVTGLLLTGTDGTTSDFAQYHGKTVILNIWATWCPPCRIELPSLVQLHRELDTDRFAVVGLSVDEDSIFLAEFIRQEGLSYDNYVDAPRRITQGRFGVFELPQTLLIDPQGRFVERITGIRDWADAEVRRKLEEIDRAGRDGDA
jgi:thiol-disulfide isomerase/thioredoxin